uniref:PSI domain-containing protein n=1 Tax=Palpitomonas bilix TaxID=652834 RepID=A0A7S3DGW3_9EUKA|mmetsp:Transcript_37069/g.96072  ORF Transcript_37069/g.96072 Transcript_37069/m.96072 type:complete len:264 (+) Transcript_37069:24-815(+)
MLKTGGTAVCQSVLLCLLLSSLWKEGEASSCDALTSCEQCIMSATSTSCGWCADGNKCMEGGYSGPTSGTCQSSDWNYVSCPAKTSCSEFSGCTNCIQSDLGDCGYCVLASGKGSCLQGNATAPPSSDCEGWYFGDIKQCAIQDPCTSLSSCDVCTATLSCGFCLATNSCVNGTTKGPNEGFCSNWAFEDDSCHIDPNTIPLSFVIGVSVGGVAGLSVVITAIALCVRAYKRKHMSKNFIPIHTPTILYGTHDENVSVNRSSD